MPRGSDRALRLRLAWQSLGPDHGVFMAAAAVPTPGQGGAATIAAGSLFGRVFLWGADCTGRSVSRIAHSPPAAGHCGAVHGLALLPRRRLLASCGDDRTVRLWRTPGTDPLSSAGAEGPACAGDATELEQAWSTFAHSDRVWRVCFWSGGVASAAKDSTAVLLGWDGSLLCRVRSHGPQGVWGIAATGGGAAPCSGEVLFTGGNDGSLRGHCIAGLQAQCGRLGPAGTPHRYGAGIQSVKDLADSPAAAAVADATGACGESVVVALPDVGAIGGPKASRGKAAVVALGVTPDSRWGEALLADGRWFEFEARESHGHAGGAGEGAARCVADLASQVAALPVACSLLGRGGPASSRAGAPSEGARPLGKIACAEVGMASGAVAVLGQTGVLAVFQLERRLSAAEPSLRPLVAMDVCTPGEATMLLPDGGWVGERSGPAPGRRLRVAIGTRSLLRLFDVVVEAGAADEAAPARAGTGEASPVVRVSLVAQLQLQRGRGIEAAAWGGGIVAAATKSHTVQVWHDPALSGVAPQELYRGPPVRLVGNPSKTGDVVSDPVEMETALRRKAALKQAVKAAKAAAKRGAVLAAAGPSAEVDEPAPAPPALPCAASRCRLLPSATFVNTGRVRQLVVSAGGDITMLGEPTRTYRLLLAEAAAGVVPTAPSSSSTAEAGLCDRHPTGAVPAPPTLPGPGMLVTDASVRPTHCPEPPCTVERPSRDGGAAAVFRAACARVLDLAGVPSDAALEAAWPNLVAAASLSASECCALALPALRGAAPGGPVLAGARLVFEHTLPPGSCVAAALSDPPELLVGPSTRSSSAVDVALLAPAPVVEAAATVRAAFFELWDDMSTSLAPRRRIALDDGERVCRALASTPSREGGAVARCGPDFALPLLGVSGSVFDPTAVGASSTAVFLSPGLSGPPPAGAAARVVISRPERGRSAGWPATLGPASSPRHGLVSTDACLLHAAPGGVPCFLTVGEDDLACVWQQPTELGGPLRMCCAWRPTGVHVRSVHAATAGGVTVAAFGGAGSGVALYAWREGALRPVFLASSAGHDCHDAERGDASADQRTNAVRCEPDPGAAEEGASFLVASATSGGDVVLWKADVRAATLRRLAVSPTAAPALSLAWVRCGAQRLCIASGHTDGQLRLWDASALAADSKGGEALAAGAAPVRSMPAVQMTGPSVVAADPASRGARVSTMGVNCLSAVDACPGAAAVLLAGGDDQSVTVVRLQLPEARGGPGGASSASDDAEGQSVCTAGAAVKADVAWVPAVSGAAIRGVFASRRCAIAMGVDEALTVWTWGEGGPGHRIGAGLPIPAHGGEAIAAGPLVVEGSDALCRAPLPDSRAAAACAGLHRVAVARFGVSDPGGLAVFERDAPSAEEGLLSAVVSGVGLELLRVAV